MKEIGPYYVVTCPNGARQMNLVRAPEHIPDVGPVVY